MIYISAFEQLGPVRHALHNGNIERPEDLSTWCASELTRRLGVRTHELRVIESYLANLGLSLAPDTSDHAIALHEQIRVGRR